MAPCMRAFQDRQAVRSCLSSGHVKRLRKEVNLHNSRPCRWPRQPV